MANHVDTQYLYQLNDLIRRGDVREGRNGVTMGLFGTQMAFDLELGFPLLTTKELKTKSIIGELLWFLSGSTNVLTLQAMGVHIWDEWADEKGELGPVYGKQWRSWQGEPTKVNIHQRSENDPGPGFTIEARQTIDQIANVIKSLKENPYGRRHIVTAWNPAEVDDMALPPCHCLFQFHVDSRGRLSCHLYQRSADWFLGVPFNIASYALLTHLIAQEVGLKVGTFTHSFGDYHLYSNHVEQATLQLSRISEQHDLPRVKIAQKSIFELTPDDIVFERYYHHPAIPAPVSK